MTAPARYTVAEMPFGDVGFRETAYTVFSGVAEDDPGRRRSVQARQAGLVDALAPWRVGGPFLSFISPLESDVDQVRSAYEPDTFDRLVALKDVYDPTNMFRFTHNIAPSRPDLGSGGRLDQWP